MTELELIQELGRISVDIDVKQDEVSELLSQKRKIISEIEQIRKECVK